MEMFIEKQAMLHSYVKILLITIVSALVGYDFSFAQSKASQLKLYKLANEKSDIGDYLNAIELYKPLYNLDSTDKEICYRIGVCYFNIKRYKSESLKYFTKAKGYDNDELSYYLGACYLMFGEYDQALEYFYLYQNSNYEKEHSFKEINDQIGKCLYAKYAETIPLTEIEISNLGDSINTPYAEYVPLIPADESSLIFTSKRAGKKDVYGEYFEDVFISKRTNNTWTKSKSISSNINTSGNDACTGFSADGQQIILYLSNDTMLKGSFFSSEFDGKDWSIPKPLDAKFGSKDYNETSACFAPDGETIFFSGKLPGGFGGKDLYMVKKLPNGEWGRPFNLGKNINTAYDEDAPFVHSVENVLYFSSQGQVNNMGGFDVFQSVFDRDSATFFKPENIGYPINTSNDDIFFVLNTNGTTGYFSSERKGGFGQSDIYKVDFLSKKNKYNVILCSLNDENNKPISGGKIVMAETLTGKITGTYSTNTPSGKFILIVEPGKQYELSIYATGYIATKENYTYKTNENLNKQFILKK